MTNEEHKQLHSTMNASLHDLLEDYFIHHPQSDGTSMSVDTLLKWSREQAMKPTPIEHLTEGMPVF